MKQLLYYISSKNNKILYKITKFNYSITKIGIFFFVIILFVSAIIISSISFYYNNLIQSQYYNNTMEILRLYNSELSSNLSNLESRLFQLGMNDTNVSLLNTTENNLQFYNSKMQVYLDLQGMFNIYDSCDGLFVYSPSSDDFTFYCNQNAKNCAVEINAFLSGNRSDIYHLPDTSNQWMPLETNNTYFVRYIVSGNSVLGAWSSFDTLTSIFKGVFAEGSHVFYLDHNNNIVGTNNTDGFTFQETLQRNNYQIITNSITKSKYLSTIESLDYSDYKIAVLIPISHFNSYMNPIRRNLAIIIVLLITGITGIALAVKIFMDAPTRILQSTLDSIQNSGEDFQLHEIETRCIEISNLNKWLNEMIQTIHDLKINIYEERIIKSKIELQLLRTQVSPHFIINCLQALAAIATSPDPNHSNYEIMQNMIKTLSNHLRYSLSTRAHVSLEEEFSYVDNYLQLISMRYPGCLTWNIQADEDMKEAMISPMLILMLSENATKHNMIMGEKLNITIQASGSFISEEKYVHITHTDTGNGFSEEMLKQCNTVLEHPELTTKGHHIGIYNIVKSLELNYNGKAKIEFSNDASGGAKIDILLPFSNILKALG